MSLKLNSKIQARKRVLANKQYSSKNYKIEDQSEDGKTDSGSEAANSDTTSGNFR